LTRPYYRNYGVPETFKLHSSYGLPEQIAQVSVISKHVVPEGIFHQGSILVQVSDGVPLLNIAIFSIVLLHRFDTVAMVAFLFLAACLLVKR